MTMDKQQERLGSGKKHAPRDNLDLDVIDTLAMGYGVHYGEFKKDHPFTKDANEARLAAMQKTKRKPPAPKPRRPRIKTYTLVCKYCGNKFTSPNNSRSYCCNACRAKAKKHRKVKKEVTA